MFSRCLVRGPTCRSLSRFMQTNPLPKNTRDVPESQVQREGLSESHNLVQKVGSVLKSHNWGQAYYVLGVLGVVGGAVYWIIRVLEDKIKDTEEKLENKIKASEEKVDLKIQHLSETTKEGFAHLGVLLQGNQSVIEGKVNDRVKVGLLEHKLEEEKTWMEIKNELNLINARLSERDKE